MNLKSISLLSILACSLLMISCETTFDPYAPEEEIYVVYGVLNPQADEQFVRVARAFRTDGDAYAYAAANDLSYSGLQVTVSENNHIYELEPTMDYPRDADGVFTEDQTVYRFLTDGSTGHPAIKANTQYTLKVGSADQETFVTARTLTPDIPQIRSPIGDWSPGNGLNCRKSISLDRDLDIEFTSVERTGCENRTLMYEIRMLFDYQENGDAKQVIWGPTVPFNCSSNCSGSDRKVCYQIKKDRILNYYNTFLPVQSGSAYTYTNLPECDPDITLLADPLEIEVTVMDLVLSTYMAANSPTILDLTGARPEYTNVESGEGVQAYGVFASINVSEQHFTLSSCTEYKLGLNGLINPPFGCE